MEFRRGGQRDERRRRVMIEESAAREPEAGTRQTDPSYRKGGKSSGAAPRQRRYPKTTLTERQPLFVAAIPTGWCSAVSVIALLLAAIAGLEAMYGYIALGYTRLSIRSVPAIDLTSRASIGAWLSSMFLLAAGLLGVLTYFIRRHRLDDYRGRYRMWCWIVPVLVLAAVDQVAGLQQSVRNALLILAGIPDYADAELVRLGVATVIVAVVLVRLAIELRDCRMAIFGVLLAGTCYSGVAAIHLNWLLAADTIFGEMAAAGLLLGGHFCLFSAVLLNARYVHRDAAGLIRGKRRARHVTPAKGAAQAAASCDTQEKQRSRTRRIVRRDPAHLTTEAGRGTGQSGGAKSKAKELQTARSNVRKARPATPQRSVSDLDLSPAAEEDTPCKLSKAERRKLRKVRRAQGRPAA